MTPEELSPEFLALQGALKGRYSLVRELGRGGMGVVFLAREVALDRLVAIKLLPPSLARDSAVRERFLREARTAAGLAHPHIVPIHAVEESDDLVWFAMEYVAGETLGQRMARHGKLPATEALRVIQEIAYALAHAHGRGVVHRDVKPDNVLLDEATDRVMVTDFGIAHGPESSDSAAGYGTLHYMAPEQAMGDAADARVDVYALGVTAFHAVTGRRPFEGYDGTALIAEQTQGDPPPVRGLAPELMPSFAETIDRAIEREPEKRFTDAYQMAQELQSVSGMVPQLPLPLRAFATEAHDKLNLLGGALSMVVMTELMLFIGFGFSDIFAAAIFHTIAALTAAVGYTSLSSLFVTTRGLMARGYRREAALRAVTTEAHDQREMVSLDGESSFVRKPFMALGTALALFVLGTMLVRSGEGTLVAIAGLVSGILAPAGIGYGVWRRRNPDVWARLLASRAGRWFFRAAGWGLAEVPEVATAGQPTALAVGSSVQSLWASLAESERQLLAEVPDLAERFEAQALHREDPHATEAMSALETLRIDLMRLKAGQLKADGMTEDIEKLRAVGRIVDAIDEV